MKNVFFFGLIVSMKLMIMNKNKILFLKSLAFLLITIVFMSCTNESQIDSEHKDSQEKIVPKVPKPEYTEKDAGEWEDIKDAHIPIIKLNRKSREDNIEISVKGEFTEQHYIERIGIMDENKQDLAGMSLKKLQKATVTLTLDPIPDNPNVKVYVECNLHDLWTKPIIPTAEK